MKINLNQLAILGAIALAATPAAAQNAATTADPYAAAPVEQEDDDSGKWGLLGLLGLAGLLGMKRRDRDDDVRRTGTGNTNR